ncbi:MAG: response regulator transcription factor [Spirochaetales bacterium]|nr:response regulator transcription factor [Spirochaetales bacterium]
MKLIQVFLADDHTIVRSGIRSLLEAEDGIEVVGEAEDGREAVEKVREIRPDVVLMDIGMSGLNGLEATIQIKQACPKVKVLILSMHTDEQYVQHALQAGGSGYLVKQAAEAELLVAIKAVNMGKTYLSPEISKNIVEGYLRHSSDGEEDDEYSILTSREREVLQLVAEGQTNKEVAVLLDISVKTVDAHRTHIMSKLRVKNSAELVLHASRMGLLK